MTKMKRGFALIAVLVASIIIGIMITALLQVSISMDNVGRMRGPDGIKAQYLAEAGIQYALWQCRNNNFSTPVTVSEDGKTITITKTPQGDGTYKIDSTVNY